MRAGILSGVILVLGCNHPRKEDLGIEPSASVPVLAPAPVSNPAHVPVPVPDPAGSSDSDAATATGVIVTNIGIHIGGGPNDPATKEPIVRSVAPHFDEFSRCFAQVERPRAGDFGVDLLIEKDGGRAKVDNPRTTLGRAFSDCMVTAFAAVDFEKPRTGRTKVSYSLSFRPAK